MKFWTGRYWLFFVSMIHIISKHSRSRLISYWDAPAADSSPPSQQTVRSLFRPHTCFATNTVTDEGNDNRRQRQMMTSNSFLYLFPINLILPGGITTNRSNHIWRIRTIKVNLLLKECQTQESKSFVKELTIPWLQGEFYPYDSSMTLWNWRTSDKVYTGAHFRVSLRVLLLYVVWE